MGPIDYSALARMLMSQSPAMPAASIPKKPGFQNPTEGAMPMRGGGGGRAVPTTPEGTPKERIGIKLFDPKYDLWKLTVDGRIIGDSGAFKGRAAALERAKRDVKMDPDYRFLDDLAE